MIIINHKNFCKLHYEIKQFLGNEVTKRKLIEFLDLKLFETDVLKYIRDTYNNGYKIIKKYQDDSIEVAINIMIIYKYTRKDNLILHYNSFESIWIPKNIKLKEIKSILMNWYN